MRDIPYILGIMLLVIAAVLVGSVWYGTDINEDRAVTDLNAALRTTSVEHISLSSRLEPGMVYLQQNGAANMKTDEPDFETALLNELPDIASITDGSLVRIDYALTGSDTVVATQYKYANKKWTAMSLSGARALKSTDPVDVIRVRYRLDGHSSNGTNIKSQDYWTYQSTVEVDRSHAVENMMD